jgi:hypothetical protein
MVTQFCSFGELTFYYFSAKEITFNYFYYCNFLSAFFLGSFIEPFLNNIKKTIFSCHWNSSTPNTATMATSLPFPSVCLLSVWQVEVFSIFTCRVFWSGANFNDSKKAWSSYLLLFYMYVKVHHNNSIFSSKAHNTLNNQTYLVEIVIHIV